MVAMSDAWSICGVDLSVPTDRTLAWGFESVGQTVDVIGRSDPAGISYGSHGRVGTIVHIEAVSDPEAVNVALLAKEAALKAATFGYLIGPNVSQRVRILGTQASQVEAGITAVGYLEIRYTSVAA